MTATETRIAVAAAAFAISAVPAALQAADLPEVPNEPLTVTCAELGIPEQACDPEMVTENQIRAMLVSGPLTGAAMAPLMEAQVFGPRGALPAPPELEPVEEGALPPMYMPVFDFDAYGEMMAAGVTRTVVVEDLGVEVTVPVIDCRYAICLPSGMTGGPAFVDWEEMEMPEMPMMPGAPAEATTTE
jgi:hypothetical protein